VMIPMLTILKARESLIYCFLVLSSLARNIIKGLATEGWMFYLGKL
jgi:hypothetical protein